MRPGAREFKDDAQGDDHGADDDCLFEGRRKVRMGGCSDIAVLALVPHADIDCASEDDNAYDDDEHGSGHVLSMHSAT